MSRLFKEDEELLKMWPGTPANYKEKNIYIQLSIHVEYNTVTPGKLPKFFYLVHVTMAHEMLDDLLKRLKINAKTTCVNSGDTYGDMYLVELTD